MSLRDPEHVIDAEFRPLPVSPNWARGFFRVWVLLAAGWCAFVYVTLGVWLAVSPGLPVYIIPPLLLGGAMVFFGWVIRGFSRRA